MPRRNKVELTRWLAVALAFYGFVNPFFKRNGKLMRITHRDTGLQVDLWADYAVSSAVESEAMRRAEATRSVVASMAESPQLKPLYTMLRRAIGSELRQFETYGGGESLGGSMGGLGAFVTLLLVRRFLHDVKPPPDMLWVDLIPNLLSTLSMPLHINLTRNDDDEEDDDDSVRLDDVLDDMPPITLVSGKGTDMLQQLCVCMLARLIEGVDLETMLAPATSPTRKALIAEILGDIKEKERKRSQATPKRKRNKRPSGSSAGGAAAGSMPARSVGPPRIAAVACTRVMEDHCQAVVTSSYDALEARGDCSVYQALQRAPSRTRAVCSFYVKPGGCRYGDSCRFVHDAGPAQPPQSHASRHVPHTRLQGHAAAHEEQELPPPLEPLPYSAPHAPAAGQWP